MEKKEMFSMQGKNKETREDKSALSWLLQTEFCKNFILNIFVWCVWLFFRFEKGKKMK